MDRRLDYQASMSHHGHGLHDAHTRISLQIRIGFSVSRADRDLVCIELVIRPIVASHEEVPPVTVKGIQPSRPREGCQPKFRVLPYQGRVMDVTTPAQRVQTIIRYVVYSCSQKLAPK
jgi:hypothetical protein